MDASDSDSRKNLGYRSRLLRIKRLRSRRLEEIARRERRQKLKSERWETIRKDDPDFALAVADADDGRPIGKKDEPDIALAIADADDGSQIGKKDEPPPPPPPPEVEYSAGTSICGYPINCVPSSSRRNFFVSDKNMPPATLHGTFRECLPWDFEKLDSPRWFEYLVVPRQAPAPPVPSPSTISSLPPPPPLALFSLTCVTRSRPRLDEEQTAVLEPGLFENLGMSFSLPLHPPPSELIPSQQHPLPPAVIRGNLLGSCKGLYCLLSGPVFDKLCVIVWNPTTGLSRRLPPFPDSDGLLFGFGYDQRHDDYKVVKIDADQHHVEVFSLYSGSESWKNVPCFAQRPFDIHPSFYNGAVSVEGCLNWLVSVDGRTTLVSFHLPTESFQTLPLPPSWVSLSLKRSSLWILDGCLSFVTLHALLPASVQSVDRCGSRVLDIWIMREYGVESSWTIAATLVFPHSVDFPFQILYLSKDVLILVVQESRLFVFNINKNSLVCPHIRGATDTFGGVEPYVQSRFSPFNNRCNSTATTDETMEEIIPCSLLRDEGFNCLVDVWLPATSIRWREDDKWWREDEICTEAQEQLLA